MRPFSYPIRRSPKADGQQFRVYRMENEAIGARHYMEIGRDTIRQLVRGVCRNYRVPLAKLVWRDLGKWAAEWEEGVITFNTRKRAANDILTPTHELAHHVHHFLSDGAADGHEAHGPEFMACHMSILDTCRVIPVVGMRAICEHYGVKYHDPGISNSLSKLQRICRKGAS